MESKICMNVSCGVTMTQTWRRGWPLRSGGFADLCDECGSAYEKSVFCNTFHAEESGWRECLLCSKRLHCGCVASKLLLELLDYGGVECVDCARSSGLDTVITSRIRKNAMYGKFITPRGHVGGLPSCLGLRKDGTAVSRPKLTPCRKRKVVCEPSISPLPKKNLGIGHLVRIKPEEKFDSYRDVCRDFTDQSQLSVGSSNFTKRESTPRPPAVHETCTDPPLLSLTWNAPMWSSTFVSPVIDYVPDEDVKKIPVLSPLDHEPNPANSLMHCLPAVADSSKALVLHSRVARPPAEGRGRNQMLPRYWPRITDQELQQLSGDLNSSIVPLFEKVLSASDAGRIGRLVLPKACAEAYFPPISQSEGLPIKIQDIKGKQWTFQFRFWPNNNSRMYVLEGVTPCIQSMELQAGDTVTFSRINPGGKLVMGFRKAASYANTQDGQAYVGFTSDLSGDSSFPCDMDDMAHHMGCGNVNQSKAEKNGGSASKKMLPKPLTSREKKSRNLSSKNKRLLMRSEESTEIRVTWEEAQDLLRPPPSVPPSIVVIEDQEFEEYDEPPVFGKRTVFISGSSGQQEQWAQCDNCSKWRRIPTDVLLPSKWTCLENVWDSKRSSCSAPERIRRKDAPSGRDKKKKKTAEFPKISEEQEASGLDALASVAVLGENAENCGDPCIGMTTKHPRHRTGCSCIVCIQPPSGQGKHEPSCTCNVCMTVKRRFKTLMLRRKIRQSEREAEAPDTTRPEEIELEMNSIAGDQVRAEHCHGRAETALPSSASTTAIDLNCDPTREDQGRPQGSMDVDMEGGSMLGFGHAASLPVQMYMKQKGFTSLMHEQQEAVEAFFLRADSHTSRD